MGEESARTCPALTIPYGAWYGGRLVYTYGIGTALVKEGMVDSTGSMENMKMPDSTSHHGRDQEKLNSHDHPY